MLSVIISVHDVTIGKSENKKATEISSAAFRVA